MFTRPLARRLVVASLLLAGVRASALDITWTGTTDGNWGTGGNWSPRLPQTGDALVFGTSSRTATTVNSNLSIAALTFNANAPAYTATVNALITLDLTGTGVVRNASATETLTLAGGVSNFAQGGGAVFHNSATAGTVSMDILGGAASRAFGGSLIFRDQSLAGSVTVTDRGAVVTDSFAGSVTFHDSSSADHASITNTPGGYSLGSGGGLGFFETSKAGFATIVNQGGATINAHGGQTDVENTASADHATITNNAGAGTNGAAGVTNVAGTGGGGTATFASAGNAMITNRGATFAQSNGGQLNFNNNSTAANATIVNEGSAVAGASESATVFTAFSFGTSDPTTATAASATITNNGATVSGGLGGMTHFQIGTADQATITNNSGTVAGAGGGATYFSANSTGGTARMINNAGGIFDISSVSTASMPIGSIEGAGDFFLGQVNLTTGGNDRTTAVAGVIKDGGQQGGTGGSLTKTGNGALTLSGANTYTGGTTVNAGKLLVSNSGATTSGTGAGAVLVNAGTLGGTGRIGGAVTVGDGALTSGAKDAFLSPGDIASVGMLTVAGAVSFQTDSTYTYEYDALALFADRLLAGGAVTIASGVRFDLVALRTTKLSLGTQFVVIEHQAAGTISGVFSNLPDGGTITDGINTFLIDYTGGTSNRDLVLTVTVPEPVTGALAALAGATLLGRRRRSRHRR